MAATIRETADYYVALLIYQYRNLPRARANIGIYVKQALGDMLVNALNTCFDIDQAVGPQLDIIGKYVGVPRQVGDPIDRPYYGFWDAAQVYITAQNTNGFTDSTNPAVNAHAIWYQSTFLGSQNTDLSDEAYQFVLKLKIILNANDGTLARIDDYLQLFFPGVVAVVDNLDMTLTYTLAQKTPISPGVLKGFLPKPMGVGIILVTLGATANHSAVNGTATGTGVITATSGSVTAAPVNGVGPYTYQWQKVSGPVIDGANPSSNSATVTFQFTKNVIITDPPVTRVTVWRCLVTDSRGLTAYTPDVTVTLTVQPPP